MTHSIIAGHRGREQHGAGGYTTEPDNIHGMLTCIECVANGGSGDRIQQFAIREIETLYTKIYYATFYAQGDVS